MNTKVKTGCQIKKGFRTEPKAFLIHFKIIIIKNTIELTSG